MLYNAARVSGIESTRNDNSAFVSALTDGTKPSINNFSDVWSKFDADLLEK